MHRNILVVLEQKLSTSKPLSVIAKTEDFVVFYKPAGVNFHCEDGEKGFVELAKEQLNTQLFSVHRLDKVTSGVILLATSSHTAHHFATMFANKEIEKFYLAISTRKPKKKQGWIKADMTQARRGSFKLLHTKNNPAITQFISRNLRVHERLFLLKLHTGKTHQARVALKSIGSAIAGDIRYANTQEAQQEDRTYLHAYALKFCYNNIHYSYVVPPQEGVRFSTPEFTEALQLYTQPWEQFS
jgi:tRNA pseudouridine32 synthase/23S rRNA pseudouridine746 synthase